MYDAITAPSQKKVFLHVQVTQPFNCDNGTCGAAFLSEHQIGWTATAGAAYWITDTFGVTESSTIGGSFTCNGLPGQRVCVVQAVAHTAYTVTNVDGACGGNSPSFVMGSPNANKVGWDLFCKREGCGSDGTMIWDDEHIPAGGPGPLAQCIGSEC